jgi:hypothetical protein
MARRMTACQCIGPGYFGRWAGPWRKGADGRWHRAYWHAVGLVIGGYVLHRHRREVCG